MSLNPAYVTAPNFQQFFVDRNGLPLANGQIFFYSDINRTDPKNVYTIAGSEANYNYIPLPNPITLSAAGTVVDDQGNPVVIYWFPYNLQFPNEQELYYVVLKDQYGAIQQTVQAWPNPLTGGGSATSDDAINYIPNGQFLAHTNIPNNTLVAGTNVVAQGGFSMEMNDPLFSTNTFEFEQIAGSPSGISNAPRYQATLTAAANLADTQKTFRVKWPDVNKFSSEPTNTYVFGFWAQASVSTNVTIGVTKFFGTGGSTVSPLPVEPLTITTEGQFYQVVLDFGSNDGTFVGALNDDYVAVDINFPVSIGFVCSFTDFAMLKGTGPIENFPLQTNADMLTRGVAGWMPTPNPDGSDLFCPLVLTREGMTFDHSGIGKIYADSGTVLATSNPLATTNDMPMDGTSYISGNYSAIGIPYKRLSDALHAKSNISSYPLWGTGPNYATAWRNYADNNQFYIITNSAGTPIATAADGATATGFGFNNVVTYAGTQTGRVSTNLLGSWNGATTFQAVALTLGTTITGATTTGLPGFSFLVQSQLTGLYAQQNIDALIGVATAASTFVLTAGVCAHLDFTYSPIGTVRLYYRVDGLGTTPAFSANDIILDVQGATTAIQIAELTAAALSGFQISRIAVTGVPTAGEYFTFQANPAALRNFTVIYSATNTATNPVPGSELIVVNLTGLVTQADVVTATYDAINRYQYYIPNFAGMFARGYDPTAIWDSDVNTRIGFGILGGPYYGTYEYGQFESHIHGNSVPTYFGAAGGNIGGQAPVTFGGNYAFNSQSTGGTETRPVNFDVNWVIKY